MRKRARKKTFFERYGSEILTDNKILNHFAQCKTCAFRDKTTVRGDECGWDKAYCQIYDEKKGYYGKPSAIFENKSKCAYYKEDADKMAKDLTKDDYFVVTYRILAYLYQCFKAGEAPDKEMFAHEALGIGYTYWANMIENITNEGYITGVSIIPSYGSVVSIRVGNIKITHRGIEFLYENSQMAKVREFLRTAKDIIPGI